MRLFKKGIIISLILIFIMQAFAPICLADEVKKEEQKTTLTAEQADEQDNGALPHQQSAEQTAQGATQTIKEGAGLSEDGGKILEQAEAGANASGTSRANAALTAPTDEKVSWGSMLLYYPLQLVIGLVTGVLETIADTISGQKDTTPQDVLFNKVKLIDTNFFDLNGSSEDFVNKVRVGVAGWYYGMRTIAIIASLCVLIYIGIRMAISSAADQKGKYKEMLKDWLVSFALIFVLHYIMMLVLYGNSQLVDIFSKATGADGSSKTETSSLLNTYMKNIKEKRYSLDTSVTVEEKFGSNIICLLMAGMTIAFLFMYIKRFIVIAFLMVLSPLITITYAIDKLR